MLALTSWPRWAAGPGAAAPAQVSAAEVGSLPGGPAPAPAAAVPSGALQRAVQRGTTADASARPPWWSPAIAVAAQQSGLPAALLAAVVEVESEGNPGAVSPAGAKGLMQLLPGTAAALGVRDIFDPLENAAGGAHYLATWLKEYAHGDAGCVADPGACPQALRLALAAYNAGPGAVQRYGGVPPYPETERYIALVTQLYAQYSAGRGG